MSITSSISNAMRHVSNALINAMPCMGTYTVNAKVRVAKGTTIRLGEKAPRWESRLKLPPMDVGRYRVISKDFPAVKQNPNLTSAGWRIDCRISDQGLREVEKAVAGKFKARMANSNVKESCITGSGGPTDRTLPREFRQEIIETIIKETKKKRLEEMAARDRVALQDPGVSESTSSTEILASAPQAEMTAIAPEAEAAPVRTPRRAKNYIKQVTTQAEIHGKPGEKRGTPQLPAPLQETATSPAANMAAPTEAVPAIAAGRGAPSEESEPAIFAEAMMAEPPLTREKITEMADQCFHKFFSDMWSKNTSLSYKRNATLPSLRTIREERNSGDERHPEQGSASPAVIVAPSRVANGNASAMAAHIETAQHTLARTPEIPPEKRVVDAQVIAAPQPKIKPKLKPKPAFLDNSKIKPPLRDWVGQNESGPQADLASPALVAKVMAEHMKKEQQVLAQASKMPPEKRVVDAPVIVGAKPKFRPESAAADDSKRKYFLPDLVVKEQSATTAYLPELQAALAKRNRPDAVAETQLAVTAKPTLPVASSADQFDPRRYERSSTEINVPFFMAEHYQRIEEGQRAIEIARLAEARAKEQEIAKRDMARKMANELALYFEARKAEREIPRLVNSVDVRGDREYLL